MYALPLKGRQAMGNEFIVSINPKTIQLNATAGASSIANGMGAILCALMAGGAIYITYAGYGYSSGGANKFLMMFALGLSLIPMIFAVAVLVWMVKTDAACPLILNRESRTVVQIGTKKLVRISWQSVRPYVEVVRVVNMSGAYSTFNLHLVELTASGASAMRQVLVKSYLGSQHEALRYYEFLRRYMDGEWHLLPEAYLAKQYRPLLWKEFRTNIWNSWIGNVPWTKRTVASKRFLVFTVPVWTAILWPVLALTILGSRLGRIPVVPKEELIDLQFNSEVDGPIPTELTEKIRPEPPLHQAERGLYAFSLILGGVLWGGFAIAGVVL